jgi:cis-3-alkyl-4-acyloxetan-2-one decarboxylase
MVTALRESGVGNRELAPAARPYSGPWEREYPFASRWFEVGEVRIHYVDEAVNSQRSTVNGVSKAVPSTVDRKPLTCLFLHGNPTWSFLWRHLISRFRGEYRCVAPDHVGCGLSDKPQDYPYTLAQHIANARALVEELDLRDIVLCVHDWGGAIGFGLAAQMPERVHGFVVCNTAAFPSGHMPLSIGLCRIPGFGALAIRAFNAFVRGALACCAVKPLTPEARAGYLAPYGNWHDRVANLRFVQDIPTGPGHPSWETLLEVERGLRLFAGHPMLLCWGGKDFVFNDSFLQEWQRRFPGARTHHFPNAGHFVTEDARDEVVASMEDWLEGITQSRRDAEEDRETTDAHG